MWGACVRAFLVKVVAFAAALGVLASVPVMDTCSNWAVARAMALTMMDLDDTCCIADMADGDGDCRNCSEACRCRNSPCCCSVRMACMADTLANRRAYWNGSRSCVNIRVVSV